MDSRRGGSVHGNSWLSGNCDTVSSTAANASRSMTLNLERAALKYVVLSFTCSLHRELTLRRRK